MLDDMFKLARLPWFVRLALAELAAGAVWALVVSRIVIHWQDCREKPIAVVALGLGLGGVAAASALWSKRERWLRVWCVLLALFGCGESYRLWLRNEYRADARAVDLWHPLSTWDLEVRRFTITLPALSENHVRVLHVSDIHLSDAMPASFIAATAAAMTAAQPDLIVLTGDYISRAERLPALASWLRLLPQARLGAYAVLGNHEYWANAADATRAVLTGAGVQVVSGRCLSVTGTNLVLCGTDEPWGPGYESLPVGALPLTTLVLSHTPDNIYALAESGADVVFSGHTHGGQMRLPFLGALIVPSRFGRRFDEGHFVVGHTQLLVSAGVGADSPPVRLWCRPELVLVDLLGREPSASAR